MGNFTLNLYKAFGLRKAKREYEVDTHMTTAEGYSTNPSKDTKFGSSRTAMSHAIKHMMQSNGKGAALIRHPDDSMSSLRFHPDTGNLTLGHATHNPAWEDQEFTPENSNDLLAQRDIEALDNMKHLHKNSLLSLKSHGNISMDINTDRLTNLPEELHTTDIETKNIPPTAKKIEARDFNKPL